MAIETEAGCLGDTVVGKEEVLRWGTTGRIWLSPVNTCMLFMAVSTESLSIVRKSRCRAFNTIGGIAVGRIEIETADCRIRQKYACSENTNIGQDNSPII
jgi:hypothetical protein